MKKLWSLAAILLSFVLVFSACGAKNEPGSTSGSADSAPSESVSGSADNAAPAEGSCLDIAMLSEACRTLTGKITVSEEKAPASAATSLSKDGSIVCEIKEQDAVIYNKNGGKVKAPENSESLFYNFKAAEFDVNGLDVSGATTLASAFENCDNARSILCSEWNTEQAQSMGSMFRTCMKLTSLDLSSFKIDRVTSIQCMFDSCVLLSDIRFAEDLNPGSIQYASKAFAGTAIKEFHLDGKNLEQLTQAREMFFECTELETVTLSGLNLPLLEKAESLFGRCGKLQSCSLKDTNAPKLLTFSFAFSGCRSMKTLDMSGFKNASVQNLTDAFMDCQSLETLDMSGFTGAELNFCPSLFSGCKSLKTVDMSGLTPSHIYDMSRAFNDCTSLQTVKLNGFKDTKIDNTESSFKDCRAGVTVGSQAVADLFRKSADCRASFQIAG